jgi:hypothetical protein
MGKVRSLGGECEGAPARRAVAFNRFSARSLEGRGGWTKPAFCGADFQYNLTTLGSIRGSADFTLFRASNLFPLLDRY